MAIYSISQGMKRIDVPENSIKNNLAVGTVLQWCGYGDHRVVIIKNLGISENFSGYGANYELIDLTTFKRSRTQALGLEHISTKRDNHIAIYITDQVLTPDDVMDILEKEKQQIIKDAHEKEVAETKSREEKDRIIKEYSHLTRVENGGYANAKLAAKNIRIELKKAFPKIKFSVRSKCFAGGDAVNVDWTDGPTREAIEKIINKYQEGSFNGMEDIYEYDHNQFTPLFGGTKYVMGQRSLSKSAYELAAKACGFQNVTFSENQGRFDGLSYEDDETIKRAAYKMRF